jgi:uncharacterized protein GlcG (DUF336 family)
LQTTDEGRIVIFGGGYPLFDADGEVVGAFGVSGGAVEQDMVVAEAGVDHWKAIRDE